MPTSSHFCLSSKTYKNNVFEGFSRLQQSDEFVDMTLAAEGHLVKVHKTLIALASPYLKEILKSVPCQHPVLFLNNVSHEVLCFILEYIYTGEVNIPSEKVKTFLNVAQSMHISGLSNIIPPREYNFVKKEEATHVSLDPGPPGVKACITINENDFNLQVQPDTESSNNEAENGQTVSQSTSNLPVSQESNQLLRPIDVNNETFNNGVAVNISENDTGYGNSTQDTTSNMDISDDTIPIPMITEGQLQQLYAKPLCNMANAGTVNNAESSNNEAENEHTGCESATNLLTSEENNQLLKPIDVNNGTSNNIVAFNISENNTVYGNSNQETTSNMNISNTNTVVSVNSGTIPIPIFIGGQLQQVYAKPLFNMANEETVNTNLSNSNQTSNYPTDFSNLFNIASNLPLPRRHDLPGHITITELPECNKIATPSTNEITEVIENQEQSDAPGNKDPGSVLYTISNRGSLQMIRDHFMYYTHYHRNDGRKRRWRCIEYRSLHCVATFDTNDGVIVSRKHKHCHPNHDKKIWQKVMQNKIFNTVKMAEDVMEKKQKIPEPVVLSDSESSDNK